MNRFRDIRSVDRVTLTRVRYCLGDGIEGDIVRVNTEWWDDEGNLVYAEPDRFAPVESDEETIRSRVKQACTFLHHPPTWDGSSICCCREFDDATAKSFTSSGDNT